MSENRNTFITKSVIILSAMTGICLCFLTLLIQYLVFPNIIIDKKEKILLNITQVSFAALPGEQLTGQNGQTIATETPLMIGVFAIGMSIKVSGTGNEGLRIRSGAGIDQTTMYLAQEGEVFRIIDGPKILDGLIWWEIEAINDPKKTGWSVQDYMITN